MEMDKCPFGTNSHNCEYSRTDVRKEVRKYHTIKVFKDRGIHNKEVQ
jgi:hypothetical protein